MRELFFYSCLLFIPSTLLFSYGELPIGTISFKIENKTYTYRDKGVGVIKKLKFKNSKIIIGFEDIFMKTHFFITIEVPDIKLKKRTELSTEYDKIYFVYRSIEGNYLVEPTVDYFPGNTKHSRKWRRFDKSERLATGIGLVDNRDREGTLFYINLNPIYKNNEIVELNGSFYGKVKFSNRTESKLVTIENGKFNIEITD